MQVRKLDDIWVRELEIRMNHKKNRVQQVYQDDGFAMRKLCY